MQWERIIFSGHAIRRMFEWRIGSEEVVTVLRMGEVIMEYPEDKPFPSRLMLGFPGDRPLHAVAALDPATGTCHVITAYVPDPVIWKPDFRTRRLS
ncbi:MAG: DUF4258 domain-containing protein [Acidobacteria bacterium]|nr:DUF4258 domain-containing protein [Acidobacteriota bacterium]